jgi:hypothetical protein
MGKILRILGSIATVLTICLLLAPDSVQAHADLTAVQASTISTGPYIIDVTLSKNPPYVDQPFTITVTPHNGALKLDGKVIMKPGSGTDAVNIPTTLKPSNNAAGTLTANVQLPVRGAWNIVIQLQGPSGPGQGSISVTAGAPGAMAPWLAWLIGASPLLFITAWIWHQHRYRRSLELQAQET